MEELKKMLNIVNKKVYNTDQDVIEEETAKCRKCGDRINAEEDSICGNCI